MDRRAWFAAGLLLLLLLALRGPTLSVGLHMDDIAQRAMVEGAYPVRRAPWDLYTFADGTPPEIRALASTGALPWWSDPQLRLSALRPLASVLVWFDARFLSPWGAHLHSLAWWAALLVVAFSALRRILGARWAGLAVLLYALDDCHVYPLAWLANRAALISCVFGWAALGAYVRESRSAVPSRWRWMPGTMAGLSLAAGEYGLSVLAFTVAYAMLGDPRPRADRARALAPIFAVVGAYAVLHRWGGFGAAHSGVYVDPLADPVAFAGAVLERAPRLLLDMATGLPLSSLERVTALVGGPWLVVMAGGIAWAVYVRGLRRRGLDDARSLRWAVLGTLGALLPVCASFLSERLTVAAAMGAHVVTAHVVVTAFDRLRDPQTRLSWPTGLAVLVGLPLLIGHGVMAPLSSRAQTEHLAAFNRAGLSLAETITVQDRRASGQHWVLLAAGDPMMLVYTPHLRAMLGHPRPRAWTVLSLAPGPARMRRVSERSVELSAVGGALLQTPLEQFFRRDPRSFRDPIELDDVRIEVVARNAQDAPTTLRFTFSTSLEDPSLRFFVLGQRGFVRYPIAGVGAQMVVPPGMDAVRAAGAGD